MRETATEQKSRNRKKKSYRKLNGRPQPILPTAIYDRPDAALLCGVSLLTILRAYYAGHLKAYRIGRHVRHMGQHLLDWLESGGRIS